MNPERTYTALGAIFTSLLVGLLLLAFFAPRSERFQGVEVAREDSPSSTPTTSTTTPSAVVPATVSVASTTTEPATPAVEPPGSCGEWRDLLAHYFGDQVEQACAVMLCESGGDPSAVGPTDDHGLMQLNRPTWEDTFEQVIGHPWFDGVYNAELNVIFADWLYRSSGWAPWTCARTLGVV